MILKTVFIISVIDLSTKNKMLRWGVCIFTKIKNTDGWKKIKTFFGYFISEIPKFFCMDFFRKCLIFRRSTPFRKPVDVTCVFFVTSTLQTLDYFST